MGVCALDAPPSGCALHLQSENSDDDDEAPPPHHQSSDFDGMASICLVRNANCKHNRHHLTEASGGRPGTTLSTPFVWLIVPI